MDYTTASTDEIDSVVPDEHGGMWFFRDALECSKFGLTLMELEPDAKGKPHDHADDRQEEVYLVVDGELTIELGADGEETVTLSEGEAVRVGPDTWRALSNRSDEPVRLVIGGAS